MPKIWNKYSSEKEYRGLSPNFHIHVSVSELYIPTMDLPFLSFLLKEIYPGNGQIAHRHMNVKIGAEAALFPEKEYINGIAVAVQYCSTFYLHILSFPHFILFTVHNFNSCAS